MSSCTSNTTSSAPSSDSARSSLRALQLAAPAYQEHQERQAKFAALAAEYKERMTKRMADLVTYILKYIVDRATAAAKAGKPSCPIIHFFTKVADLGPEDDLVDVYFAGLDDQGREISLAPIGPDGQLLLDSDGRYLVGDDGKFVLRDDLTPIATLVLGKRVHPKDGSPQYNDLSALPNQKGLAFHLLQALLSTPISDPGTTLADVPQYGWSIVQEDGSPLYYTTTHHNKSTGRWTLYLNWQPREGRQQREDRQRPGAAKPRTPRDSKYAGKPVVPVNPISLEEHQARRANTNLRAQPITHPSRINRPPTN